MRMECTVVLETFFLIFLNVKIGGNIETRAHVGSMITLPFARKDQSTLTR